MFKSKRMVSSIISGIFAVQILTSTVFNPLGLGNVEASNVNNPKQNLPTVSEFVYSTPNVIDLENGSVVSDEKQNGKRIIVKYKDPAKRFLN